MHRTSHIAALLALSAFTPACLLSGNGQLITATPNYSVQTTVVTPPPPTFNASVTANVTVPTGVMVLQAQCQPGTQEACNGLDDNCDGVIDEGCGYSGGNIQVTAAWQTSSDIDLHVTDPMGQEVFYGNRAVASGGTLDHDANAACAVRPPTVENVYWSTPTPPRGTYQVRLEAYDMCGSPSTPTTVSISVGGRIVGAYNMNFLQTHQSYTLQFVVP